MIKGFKQKWLSSKIEIRIHRAMKLFGAKYALNLGLLVSSLILFQNLGKA